MMIKYFLILSSTLLFLSGCLTKTETKDKLSEIGESTCLSASAIAYDGIQIQFAIPNEAIMFVLKRNGEVILETDNKEETSFIDSGLIEGQTYRYRCAAIIDVNQGLRDLGQQLTVTLEASTAPTFDGIQSLVLNDVQSATVGWALTSDQIISHYKIFKYIGTATDRSQFPSTPEVIINDLAQMTEVINNLGDQITYSFRVSACNASDVCDENNETLSLTMPDNGVPGTSGATGISLLNGSVNLTVPWTDSLGLIQRRRIFRANVNLGEACPSIFGLYGNVNDVVINEPRDTPTTVVASGTLNEGSKYCFIVRDVDSLSQSEMNMNVQSVEIGDLTPPEFNSTLTLQRDSLEPETKLNLSWTAMLRESDDALNGANDYLIFLSSAVHPNLPDSDPCVTGSQVTGSPLSSSPYSSGSTINFDIEGLSPRNNYRVCVKARDSSLNISSQSPKALISTGDNTAPVFAGIQALRFLNGKLEYDIIIPAASDVRNYRITTIRTRASVENSPIVLTKTISGTAGQTVTQDFTLAEASLIDNDSVKVRVDVCDNASPDFNSIDNCSATSAEESIAIPDATPPASFSGIVAATQGSTNSSIQVSWTAPPSWVDYVGFKVSYVNEGGNLVGLNSSNCICASNDCESNPILTCEVSQTDGGAFLDPSKLYEMYVAAFDLVGNSTEQYIPYQGGAKVTTNARASDTIAPIFNANFVGSYESGVKLLFDQASDNQYSGAPDNLDISYQVYRKEGATFTCPSSPEVSLGGCDGLSVYENILQSSLSTENGKLVYVDSSVTDGVHYYYQLCALDFAGNRRCNTGSVGDVNVQDVTAPVIANEASNKSVGGGTSWTVNFDISDNSASYSQLIVRVYKSLTDFPDQISPGTPVYESGNGTVSVNPSTGAASFTDTGTADVPEAYYLILVQDLNGNKAFLELRDMPEAPVITNVTWSAPLHPDGNPLHGMNNSNSITITGTNLDQIEFINESSSPASTGDRNHCQTSSIVSRTDTEIVCDGSGLTRYSLTYTLYFSDYANRDLTYASGSPWRYCDYADFMGITALAGTGASSRPYVPCTPDHIKQIGRNADNPNNSEDIIGHFWLGRDIDFSGVTDFNGIPVMQADEFFLHGNNYTISNITIDKSSSNEEAAFVLGCQGSNSLGNTAFMRFLNLDNIVVRTGSARGAILLLEKNCDGPSGQNFLQSVDVTNSEVHSDNTAGIISAQYNINNDNVFDIVVEDSKIYSSRAHGTGLGTGIFAGIMGQTSGAVADSTLDFLQFSSVEVNPSQSSGLEVGDQVGLVVGLLNSPRVTVTDSELDGINRINGATSSVGGVVGLVGSSANNFAITNTSIDSLVVDTSGVSSLDSRGGLIGYIDSNSTDLLVSDSKVENSSISGNTNIGGFIGYASRLTGATINGSLSEPSINNVNLNASTASGGGIIGQLTQASGPTLSQLLVVNTSITGANSLGGMIGQFQSNANGSSINTVERCAFYGGSVIGVTGAFSNGGAAGIIGRALATENLDIINNAVADSQIQGNPNVGGLVGAFQYYNDPAAAPDYEHKIEDNYISGDVVIEGDNGTGGLIGNLLYFANLESGTTISRNAIHARVVSSSANSGTFVGRFNMTSNTNTFVFDNYYRNDWTGTNVVTTNPAFPEPEGKTAAELAVQATYVNWDFTNTWEMDGVKAKLQVFSGIPEL